MKIPQDFLRPSLAASLAFIGYGCSIIAVFGSCSLFLLSSDLAVWMKAMGLLACGALTAQGFILLGIASHDGYHLSLHRDPFVSCLIGTLCAAPLPLYSAMGFALHHRNHHRFTNGPDDPDCAIIARFRTAPSRLLFVKAALNRTFLRNVVFHALGRDLPYRIPHLSLPRRQVMLLAWVDLLAGILFLAFYAWLIAVAWRAALAFIVIPYVLGLLIDSPRPYIEHAGTGDGELHGSRTRTSALATLFYGGLNYHLEHHLYPGVPVWRLPKLHRHLSDAGLYADAKAEVHVERSFFRAFRFVRAAFAYPMPEKSTNGPHR